MKSPIIKGIFRYGIKQAITLFVIGNRSTALLLPYNSEQGGGAIASTLMLFESVLPFSETGDRFNSCCFFSRWY